MRFEEEFSHGCQPEKLLAALGKMRFPNRDEQHPLRLMEVCGTHTMAIAKSGIKQVLPKSVRLLSGPGCPVCVTPAGAMDEALRIAMLPDVILASYGDLLRVPGSVRGADLAHCRARGADPAASGLRIGRGRGNVVRIAGQVDVGDVVVGDVAVEAGLGQVVGGIGALLDGLGRGDAPGAVGREILRGEDAVEGGGRKDQERIAVGARLARGDGGAL